MKRTARLILLCLVVGVGFGASATGDETRDLNGCQCVLEPVYWCDSIGCTQIGTKVVIRCPSKGGGASGSW